MTHRSLVLPVILGVTLFAILMLLTIAMYQTRGNTRHIAENTMQLQKEVNRSCYAIKGASLYWKSERQSVLILLKSPVSPDERASETLHLKALNHVINLADHTSCP